VKKNYIDMYKMAYEERYSGIVRRLKDTIRGLTMKLIGLFLLIAGSVGAAVAFALRTYKPSQFLNDKGKVIEWRVGLTAAAAGLLVAGGAYFGGLI